MRKLLVLTAILAILLCACNPGSNSDSSEAVSVILPDSQIAATVNGYLTEGVESNSNTEKIEYFANMKSKKFHLSSCHWATSMNEENLYKSYNRNLLISDGYEPCKTCKP